MDLSKDQLELLVNILDDQIRGMSGEYANVIALRDGYKAELTAWQEPKTTWEEIVAAFPADYKPNESIKDDVCWWCAYHEAEALDECNGVKDWARLLLTGCTKIDEDYVRFYVDTEVQLRKECFDEDDWRPEHGQSEVEVKIDLLSRMVRWLQGDKSADDFAYSCDE